MHINTRGLVLRETKYKEKDKLLTVLTPEYGKLTVRARGLGRKGGRLEAAAQLLVYSEMTLFSYRDYYTLDEANSIRQFWGIKSDLELLALASYFAELTELVAEEGSPADEPLSLFLNAMHALETLKKPPELVKAAFELKLLSLSGYEPLLGACAVCGQREPAEPRLHLVGGVLHCGACRGKLEPGVSLRLCGGSLAAMRYVARGNPKRLFSFSLTGGALRRFTEVCEAYAAAQLEQGFHTLDFYKQFRNDSFVKQEDQLATGDKQDGSI